MRLLNLLPWRTWQEQQRKKKFLSIVLGLSTVILLLTLGIHWQLTKIISRQQLKLQQLQQLQQTNEQLQSITLQTQKKLQTINQQLQELQQLNIERYFLLNLFNLLANKLPNGIYLTALTQQDAIVQIEGYAANHQAVTQLVTILNSTPEFYPAQLQFIKEIPEKNQLIFAIHINRIEQQKYGA